MSKDLENNIRQQLAVILADAEEATPPDPKSIPSPRAIKKGLDEYVIAQDGAKKQISVAFHKHLVRKRAIEAGEEIVPKKSNVMLIGPTGCGKTYMLQTLSKQFELPFAIVDMAQMSQSGYVGSSIADLSKQLEEIAKNKHDAEFGVVLLDEIDKLSSRGDSTNNVGHIPVQQELLKVVEGMELGGLKTDNILFVAAGAFLGEVHESRTEVAKSMGFGGGVKETRVSVNDQLVEYGLLPELIGRFQIGTELLELTKDDLINVMKHSKDSVLKNLIDTFKLDGIDLTFTRGALEAIAEIATKKGTGARALNSTLEATLRDLQFDVLGEGGCKDPIHITKKTVKEY